MKSADQEGMLVTQFKGTMTLCLVPANMITGKAAIRNRGTLKGMKDITYVAPNHKGFIILRMENATECRITLLKLFHAETLFQVCCSGYRGGCHDGRD